MSLAIHGFHPVRKSFNNILGVFTLLRNSFNAIDLDALQLHFPNFGVVSVESNVPGEFAFNKGWWCVRQGCDYSALPRLRRVRTR